MQENAHNYPLNLIWVYNDVKFERQITLDEQGGGDDSVGWTAIVETMDLETDDALHLSLLDTGEIEMTSTPNELYKWNSGREPKGGKGTACLEKIDCDKRLREDPTNWHTVKTAGDAYTGTQVLETVGKYVTTEELLTPKDVAERLQLDVRELVKLNNTRWYQGKLKATSRLPLGTKLLYGGPGGPDLQKVESQVIATNYLSWTVRHLDGSGDVVDMTAVQVRGARWDWRCKHENWKTDPNECEFIGKRIRRSVGTAVGPTHTRTLDAHTPFHQLSQFGRGSKMTALSAACLACGGRGG